MIGELLIGIGCLTTLLATMAWLSWRRVDEILNAALLDLELSKDVGDDN